MLEEVGKFVVDNAFDNYRLTIVERVEGVGEEGCSCIFNGKMNLSRLKPTSVSVRERREVKSGEHSAHRNLHDICACPVTH